MARLKTKGDLAELLVAANLVARGFRVALPFGEDTEIDLVFWRPPVLDIERVQVKHATSDGDVIRVKACTHSLTNGRVRQTKRYTSQMIDWLAVYDATTGRIFYLPASELGDGMREVALRLNPARNNQQARIRMADNFSVPTIRAT